MRINFDVSQSEIENLLAAFLKGAVGVELRSGLDIFELPDECCRQLRIAEAAGRAWTAWDTERGPVAAWGDYHSEPSKRLFAYLLFVEWWLASTGHHSLWCYCDPKRPTEWTVGRGRP